MPEDDELERQAKHLEKQMDKLATYASTLRRLMGRLGELNYRYNSNFPLSAAEQHERVELPKQLRETRRAIRADFPDMPATLNGIEKTVRKYHSDLFDVKVLQENQERLSYLTHTRPTTKEWRELVEEAARRRAPEPEIGEVEHQTSPQHTPQKRPLRDLYLPDTEHPEQRDEPDRSR